MKSEYVHHKAISGAIGVKLCATGIEKAVAGTPIMVIGPDDDEEDIKEEVGTQLDRHSLYIDNWHGIIKKKWNFRWSIYVGLCIGVAICMDMLIHWISTSNQGCILPQMAV